MLSETISPPVPDSTTTHNSGTNRISGGKSLPLFYLQLRGLLLLALAAYWALYPASENADIVAATLSYAILTFLVLISLITLITGIITRKKIHVRAYVKNKRAKEFDTYSGEESTIVYTAHLPGVLPFFQYELTGYFEPESLERTLHVVRGKLDSTASLEENVCFPHRGVWSLDMLSVAFGDRFGLTSFKYELRAPAFHKDIKISPPVVEATNLPVLSSTQTTGDEISAEHDRRGDFLDIKPYHPADGTRRILWKIFARSGELLSRHPERTYTPEGEILMYLPAGKSDDLLCGFILKNLEHLEDRGMAFRIRCEGQLSGTEDARTISEARTLLIQSVWDSEHFDLQRTCQEIQPLISSMSSSIYLPISSHRLASQPFNNLLQRLAGYLSSKGATPSFLVLSTAQRDEERTRSQREDDVHRFNAICASRGWKCNVIYL